MAPPNRIDGWMQIVVHATQEGSERIMTHNYRTNDPITDPTTCEAIAFQFWDTVDSAIRGATNQNVNFDYIECRTLYTDTANYVGYWFIPQPMPGLVSGDATPANASVGIRWKTGVIGRRYRGRNEAFGLSEQHTANSTILSAELIQWATYAGLVFAFSPTIGPPLLAVVASRVGGILVPVLDFLIDNLVDSMRTRLIQRGR